MTSPITRPPGDPASPGAPRPRGFTLIELILVMALLAIAFGVTFPTLRTFFRGRVLDSEAHRLLALTRYAQNRAATEGMSMILWFDAAEGFYGLQAAPGYLDEDPRAVEYQIDNDLRIEVAAPPPNTRSLNVTLPSAASQGTSRRSILGLPTLRLLPDGYIDPASPEFVAIREGDEQAVWLVQTTNRLAYVLQSEPPVTRVW